MKEPAKGWPPAWLLLQGLQTLPAEDPVEAAQAAEAVWDAIQAGSWPFQALCDSLCADLLSPRWESRHGAATALREVLRTHASSAAVQAPLSADPSGDMVFCTAPNQATPGLSSLTLC